MTSADGTLSPRAILTRELETLSARAFELATTAHLTPATRASLIPEATAIRLRLEEIATVVAGIENPTKRTELRVLISEGKLDTCSVEQPSSVTSLRLARFAQLQPGPRR